MSPRLSRIPALDGLRGLAALGVFLLHSLVYGPQQLTSALARAIDFVFRLGWIGVDIFFVLSGFLITRILLSERQRDPVSYFLTFYARRALRIFPVYFLCLFLLFIVVPSVGLTYWFDDYAGLAARQHWMWLYLQNLAFVDPAASIYDSYPGLMYVGHTWSLAVEEQFYLLWPAFVWWIRDPKQIKRWCVGIVIAVLAVRFFSIYNGVHHHVMAFHTLTRIDELTVGAWIAVAYRKGMRWRSALLGAGLALSIVALSVGTFDPFCNETVAPVVTYTLLAIACGALLVGILEENGRLVWFLTLEPLQKLGRISYAFYLFHQPVLYFVRLPWVRDGGEAAFLEMPIRYQILFASSAFVLTYGLAWVSWHLIEKRCLRLKTFFPLQEKKPLPSAEPECQPG